MNASMSARPAHPRALQQLLELELLLDQKLLDWRLDSSAAAASAMVALEWSACVWAAAETAGPCPIAPRDVERGLALARRPVFICGVHRSGTTLMRDLLDSHPALSVLPAEGAFHCGPLRRIAGRSAGELRALGCEWVRRLANHSNQPPFWLLGRSGPTQSPYVRFACALLAWWPIVERALARETHYWPLVAVAPSARVATCRETRSQSRISSLTAPRSPAAASARIEASLSGRSRRDRRPRHGASNRPRAHEERRRARP